MLVHRLSSARNLSFLLGVFLGVGLLCWLEICAYLCMGCLTVFWGGCAVLLSRSCARELQGLHSVLSPALRIVTSTQCRQHLVGFLAVQIVVPYGLTCVSIMTDKHLFMHWFVIHVYSLVKHLFKSFACLLNYIVSFPIVESRGWVTCPEHTSFSDAWFADFPLNCGLPFLFLTASFKGKFLILIKFGLFMFSYMICHFIIIHKKSLLNPRSQRLSPMFSTGRFFKKFSL